MSRSTHAIHLTEPLEIGGITLPSGTYQTAAGCDAVCGWFVQVFNPVEDEPELLLDRDTLEHGLTWTQLTTILTRLRWTPQHIRQVLLRR
jgi:hypothetical protein